MEQYVTGGCGSTLYLRLNMEQYVSGGCDSMDSAICPSRVRQECTMKLYKMPKQRVGVFERVLALIGPWLTWED